MAYELAVWAHIADGRPCDPRGRLGMIRGFLTAQRPADSSSRAALS